MLRSETLRNVLFMGLSLLFFASALAFLAHTGLEELSFSVEQSIDKVFKDSAQIDAMNLTKLTDSLGQNMSEFLAKMSLEHLLEEDYAPLSPLVNGVLQFPDILSIVIKRSDGLIVAGEAWLGSLDGAGRIKGFRSAVLHEGKMVGSVEIVTTTAYMDSIHTGVEGTQRALVSSFKSGAETVKTNVRQRMAMLAATLLVFFLIINASAILGFFAPLRRMTDIIKSFAYASLSDSPGTHPFTNAGSGGPAHMLGEALENFKTDIEQASPTNTSDEFAVLSSALISMADLLKSRIKIQEAIASIMNTAAVSATKEELAWNLLELVTKETGSCMGAFYIRDELDPDTMLLLASAGLPSGTPTSIDASALEGQFGTPILDNEVHILDIPPASSPPLTTIAGDILPAQVLTLPITVRDKPAAFLTMASLKPYREEMGTALSIIKKGLNAVIANLLAGERERTLVQDLQAANQELAAQSEELEFQARELEAQNVELCIQRSNSEKVSQLKSEFMSNMSHELRTPLNSILALSRVLSSEGKDRLTEEEQEYLAIIERNGKDLLSLINGILDLSRIEAGREELRLKKTRVENLLTETMESVRPLAMEKGIYIEGDIERNLPPVVTDEEKLRRLILNIVGNAMKFTDEGGVRLSASAEGSSVRVVIEDTGIGIEESELPFIFDEFRQSDGSAARKFEGTGLGLAIAKKLSEILDIDMSVKSVVNEGTAFTLLINERPGAEDRIPSEAYVEGPRRRARPETAPHIHVIDDNPVEAMQLRSTLEHNGIRVSVFHGVDQSLRAMAEETPDGLIVDLFAQDMDGMSFLNELRRKDCGVPILLLTSRVLKPGDTGALREYGVRFLALRGEVGPEELITKVRMMISEGRGRGEVIGT
ncbi:MAG: response regulator [Synergistaceae bacterium]|nr:ATP-binding protein [Synergistota bacterium]NLM71599.1 response regulator [Synergistaceae bacterium]